LIPLRRAILPEDRAAPAGSRSMVKEARLVTAYRMPQVARLSEQSEARQSEAHGNLRRLVADWQMIAPLG
jgi:hypothetical protein